MHDILSHLVNTRQVTQTQIQYSKLGWTFSRSMCGIQCMVSHWDFGASSIKSPNCLEIIICHDDCISIQIPYIEYNGRLLGPKSEAQQFNSCVCILKSPATWNLWMIVWAAMTVIRRWYNRMLANQKYALNHITLEHLYLSFPSTGTTSHILEMLRVEPVNKTE